jgi:acetate kinase
MKILVLNSGSSSQKLCMYDLGETLPDDSPGYLWDAKIEWDGVLAASTVKHRDGSVHKARVKVSSRADAVQRLLEDLWSGGDRVLCSRTEIDAVGHRIVHGGPQFEQPMLITPEVKSGIASAATFAPLHNRAELEGIGLIEKLLGSVSQIAVFDTGFHRKMPLEAVVYPLPYEWFTGGIRRYGFHGINHQYCAARAAQILHRDIDSLRLVTCHLGNGCSLAAIRDGHSIDTTMGFTPLEGLMMGTRSGSVDPGILTFLMRQGRLKGQEIDDVLNQKSGLLGISGLSADMRQILAALKQGNPRAKLAFDIYVHRLRAGIGAMAAVLGGIDALVFTAGVGENSPEVREATCEHLEFLGLKFDQSSNAQADGDQDIASSDSRVRVLVIRAQEDWAIARECWKLARVKTGAKVGNVPGDDVVTDKSLSNL